MVKQQLNCHHWTHSHHSQRKHQGNSQNDKKKNAYSQWYYSASAELISLPVLHTWTTKRVERTKVSTWKWAATKPTPLILTNWASHVIASSYFFHKSLTFFTFLNIFSIFPILNFLLKCTLTTWFWMGLSITMITNQCLTFRTFACFLFRICINNNRTFRIRTPFQMRIFMNLQISKKLSILIKGRSIHRVLNKISRKRNVTVRTRKSFNPHVTNLHSYIQTYSLRYISMHYWHILCTTPLILIIYSSTT